MCGWPDAYEIVNGKTRENVSYTRVAEGTTLCCAKTTYSEQLYTRDIAYREHSLQVSFKSEIKDTVASAFGGISGFLPLNPLASASAAFAAIKWPAGIDTTELKTTQHDSTWFYAMTDFKWRTVEGSVKTVNIDCESTSPKNVGGTEFHTSPLGYIEIPKSTPKGIAEQFKNGKIEYKTESEREDTYKKLQIPYNR